MDQNKKEQKSSVKKTNVNGAMNYSFDLSELQSDMDKINIQFGPDGIKVQTGSDEVNMKAGTGGIEIKSRTEIKTQTGAQMTETWKQPGMTEPQKQQPEVEIPRPPQKGLPWLVIALAYILFFPAGIYLMVVKLNKDSGNMIGNGKCAKRVGKVFLAFAVIYLLLVFFDSMQFTKEQGDNLVLMFAIFFIIGIFHLLYGKKYMKLGEDYEKYAAAIKHNRNGSLDLLAQNTGDSYETVCSKLQKMINMQLFPGSYIDNSARRLISPIFEGQAREASCSTSAQTKTNAERESEKPEGPRTVKCPNCGGVNTITGTKGNECEYCGSPLE